MPPLYLRVLTNLDNSITAASAKEKDAKKKMNASNARALTAVKQKVKKNLKEHETLIKAYTEVSSAWMILRSLVSHITPFQGSRKV